MRIRFLSLISTLLITALIFGCSGGGGGGSSSSSSPPPDTSTTPSSGTISDPYVYNAWFDEISATDGAILQSTTGVSDIKGNFTFPDALTAGSTITMRTTAGVMHATPTGVTTKYEGPILTRRVSAELVAAVANGEEVIVTPLTTYAEQLQTAGLALNEDAAVEQILALIGNDLITDKKQLFADPMEAFETDGDNDPTLLQVSMAINVALEVGAELFEETFEKTLVLVQTILPKNEDGSAPSEDQFVAANAIIEVVASSEDPGKAAGAFEESKVEAIIAAVENLENGEVIVVADDGGVATNDYQDLFDTEFSAAKDSLETILSGDLDGINAELIACANAFNQAKSTLELAKEASAAITVATNDEDALNFFYAFSRIALLANPLTDNSENGLQRLSDVLDALGAPTDNAIRTEEFGLEICTETPIDDGNGGNWIEIECNSTLFTDHDSIPDTTPSGSELQQFIYQRAGAELQNAVAALNEVSADFDLELTYDGVDTDFDNGDVLYTKAAANAALFQANLLQGLNINADIKALAELDSTDNDTMQDALNVTTDGVALKDSLLKTKDAAALTAAKEFGILAVNGMKEAIVAIEAEKDDDGQENDFINFYEADATEQAEIITKTVADLDKALELLKGATNFDDCTINISGLFAGTIDLNSLLPTFTGDTPSMLPDATLGGMISGNLDINADEYGDGVPDILEYDGKAKFTAAMLNGKAFKAVGNNLNWYGTIAFNEDGTFNKLTEGENEATGTWELAPDGLSISLTYDASNVTETILFNEGEDEEGYGIEFEVEWNNDAPYLIPATTITHFTNEMVVYRSLRLSTASTNFNAFFNDNGNYNGLFQRLVNNQWSDFNVDGTWSIDVNGLLVLTPSSDCEAMLGKDSELATVTFEITQGYIPTYPWENDALLQLERRNYDSNGDLRPISGFTSTYNF